ncbi:hypothetical protein FBU59_001795, partial [Linderina macrospora]
GSSLIGPGQSHTVDVVIIAPYGLKESERWFYGGYLNFELAWGGSDADVQTLVVPYAGFNGDFSKLDVLAEPSSDFPRIVDNDLKTHDDLTAFAADVNNTLVLEYRLDLPSRLVTATLLDSKNSTVGYLPDGYVEYATRNMRDAGTEMNEVEISGTVFTDSKLTKKISVPNGLYRAQIKALRPFGDTKKASDYQTWTSQVFSIA